MATHHRRHDIAHDTLRRTPSIIVSTPGASASSIFINSQLPMLGPSECPGLPPTTVRVDGRDSFAVAREVMRDERYEGRGRTAVLNMASDERRAGGWLEYLTRTQEEALCYSSTLYVTLKEQYYPWPNLGPGSVAGIFSPAVVVFKDDLAHDCVDLPATDREFLSVISVAAPRRPQLTDDGTRLAKASDLEDFRGKIRLVYRMAATHGAHALILGPMGCGAYACPPAQVAEEMKTILLEDEFKGWFGAIIFAVFRSPTHVTPTYDIFKRAFDGLVV